MSEDSSFGPLSAGELRAKILISYLEESRSQKTSSASNPPWQAIAGRAGLSISDPRVPGLVMSLVDEGLLAGPARWSSTAEFSPPTHLSAHLKLTGAGFVRAEDAEANQIETESRRVWLDPPARQAVQQIPTSDGYVEINHNEPNFRSLMESIERLEALVQDHRRNNFREKETILKEIAATKAILEGTVVRKSAIAVLVGGLAWWLMDQFASQPIGEAASVVWSTLKLWLGL